MLSARGGETHDDQRKDGQVLGMRGKETFGQCHYGTNLCRMRSLQTVATASERVCAGYKVSSQDSSLTTGRVTGLGDGAYGVSQEFFPCAPV